MPQVEGKEAVRHGRLRHGAFVHVQHKHTLEIQRPRFCQAHHLKSLVGFAKQVDAFVPEQAFGHVANFLGCGEWLVGVLKTF